MRRTNTSHLSEILNEFIKTNKLEDGIDNARINGIWEDVTGTYIAKSTKNIYVKNNELFVSINSSIIRNEIILIKSELVKRMNKKIGREFIKNIIVR